MDWLKNVIDWFSELFKNVFVSLWFMVVDAFSWLFEQVLDIAIAAVSALDLGELNNVSGWGALPSEIINILGLLGVGAAAGVSVSAIGIRLALQLIPFTRLGS